MPTLQLAIFMPMLHAIAENYMHGGWERKEAATGWVCIFAANWVYAELRIT